MPELIIVVVQLHQSEVLNLPEGTLSQVIETPFDNDPITKMVLDSVNHGLLKVHHDHVGGRSDSNLVLADLDNSAEEFVVRFLTFAFQQGGYRENILIANWNSNEVQLLKESGLHLEVAVDEPLISASKLLNLEPTSEADDAIPLHVVVIEHQKVS